MDKMMKILFGLMILSLVSSELGKCHNSILKQKSKKVLNFAGKILETANEKFLHCNIIVFFIFAVFRKCYFYTFLCETIATRGLNVALQCSLC